MIPLLLWIGGPLSIVLWLIGLPKTWAGEPRLSIYGAVGGIVIGMVCALGAVAFPRNSSFWLGSMGQGDGFGLIGLTVFGAGLALASFIALGLTAIVGNHRRGTNDNEVSE